MATRTKKSSQSAEPIAQTPARMQTRQGKIFAQDPASRLLLLLASSNAQPGQREDARCELLPFWAEQSDQERINSAISAAAALRQARSRLEADDAKMINLTSKHSEFTIFDSIDSAGLGAILALHKEHGGAMDADQVEAEKSIRAFVDSIDGIKAQRVKMREDGIQKMNVYRALAAERQRDDPEAVQAKKAKDDAHDALYELERQPIQAMVDAKSIDAVLLIAASALPAAVEAEHAKDLSQEKIEALLASGRQLLGEGLRIDAQRLETLLADPEACQALCRLAFKGPTDIGAATLNHGLHVNANSTRLAKLIEVNHWIFDLPHASLRGENVSKMAHPTASLGIEMPRSSLWSTLSFLLVSHFRDSSTIRRPVNEILPMAIFSMGRALEGRDALANASGSFKQEDGAWSSETWAKVHGLGDFASSQLGAGESNARAFGALARGDHACAILNDAQAILQWRNPGHNLAGYGYHEPVGPKAIRHAMEEAKAFQEHAPRALRAALEATRLNPGERARIASCLAGRVAAGFASVREEATDQDYLPDYEAPAPKGALPAVIGELALDPMGKLAVSAARLYGLSPENPMGVVGEAKRALIQNAGLSNAAWKNLASNPELRKAFADIAKEAAIGASKSAPKLGTRGAKAKAEEVMKMADASGKSAANKVAILRRSEDNSRGVDAYARLLSAAALINIAPESQADLLALAARSRHMMRLFSGSLPTMPQAARELGVGLDMGGIFEVGASAEQLHQEAMAIPELLPGLLRSMNAKLIRAGASKEAKDRAEVEMLAALESICDVAKNMPIGFWSGLDRKDPMSHGLRQHEEWVELLRLRQMKANPDSFKPWQRALGNAEIGNVQARELISGQELHEEGAAMHHCVSSYSSRCHQGGSRIFAMSLSGARASTLELAAHSANGTRIDVDFSDLASRRKVDHWRKVQHNGKCNAQVTHPNLLDAAEQVAKLATDQFKLDTLALEKRLAEEALKDKAKQSLAPAVKSVSEKLAERAAGAASNAKPAAPQA